MDNLKFQIPKKLDKIREIPIRTLFWEHLEMSSLCTSTLPSLHALRAWRRLQLERRVDIAAQSNQSSEVVGVAGFLVGSGDLRFFQISLRQVFSRRKNNDVVTAGFF